MNAALLLGSGPLAIRILLGVTALWLLAAAATLLARRSAAWRHRLWSLAALASLLLPIIVGLLPEIRVGWISVESTSTMPTSAPASVAAPVDRGEVLERSPAETRADQPQSIGEHALPPPPASTSVAPTAVIRGPARPSIFRSPYLWLLVLLAPALWQWLGIVRSLLVARALLRRAGAIGDPELLGQLAHWQTQLKYPWAVRLLESVDTPVPLCAGWWRPAILLPDHWRTWSADAVHAALGHELAHVVRRDLAWQLLAQLACGLYWFHPLAWLVAWRMKIERETACDDMVLAAGQQPVVYARVLVDLASRLSEASLPPGLVLPMATRSSLEDRVRGILAVNRSRSPIGRWSGTLLTVAAVAAVLLAGMLSPLARDLVSPSVAAADDEPQRAPTTQEPVPAISGNQIEVHGQVLDEAGKPAKNIRVTAIRPLDRPQTRTDDEGKFSLVVPRSERPYLQLLADDGGSGFVQGLFSRWRENRLDLPDPLIKLGKTRAVLLKVVDSEERPVELARFGVGVRYATLSEQITGVGGEASLLVPAGVPLYYIYAYKDGVGMDYFHYTSGDELHKPELLDQANADRIVLTLRGARTVRIKAVDEQGNPMSGVEVHPDFTKLPGKSIDLNATWTSQITDADGIAEFRAMPANAIGTTFFRAHRDGYERPDTIKLDTARATNEATVTLRQQVPVRGSVMLPDGMPAAHAVVQISGRGPSKWFQAETTCNAAGEFEEYVDLDRRYLFTARLDRLASAGETQEITAGKEIQPVKLKLEPATRVFGTLLGPGEGQPLAGEYVEAELMAGDDDPGLKKNEFPRIRYNAKTDERGRFELFAGRGKYKIWGTNFDSKRGPTIELTGQKEHELKLVGDNPPQVEIVGRVVVASDPARPVFGAKIDAVQANHHSPGSSFAVTADDDGRFKAKRMPEEMWLWARSPDNKLGARVKLAREAKEIVVALAPTGSAHGRLVTPGGEPLPGRLVRCNFPLGGEEIRDRFWINDFGVSARTNAKGEFTLHGLVVGETYDLSLDPEKVNGSIPGLGNFKVRSAEPIELGDDVGSRWLDERLQPPEKGLPK